MHNTTNVINCKLTNYRDLACRISILIINFYIFNFRLRNLKVI